MSFDLFAEIEGTGTVISWNSKSGRGIIQTNGNPTRYVRVEASALRILPGATVKLFDNEVVEFEAKKMAVMQLERKKKIEYKATLVTGINGIYLRSDKVGELKLSDVDAKFEIADKNAAKGDIWKRYLPKMKTIGFYRTSLVKGSGKESRLEVDVRPDIVNEIKSVDSGEDYLSTFVGLDIETIGICFRNSAFNTFSQSPESTEKSGLTSQKYISSNFDKKLAKLGDMLNAAKCNKENQTHVSDLEYFCKLYHEYDCLNLRRNSSLSLGIMDAFQQMYSISDAFPKAPSKSESNMESSDNAESKQQAASDADEAKETSELLENPSDASARVVDIAAQRGDIRAVAQAVIDYFYDKFFKPARNQFRRERINIGCYVSRDHKDTLQFCNVVTKDTDGRWEFDSNPGTLYGLLWQHALTWKPTESEDAEYIGAMPLDEVMSHKAIKTLIDCETDNLRVLMSADAVAKDETSGQVVKIKFSKFKEGKTADFDWLLNMHPSKILKFWTQCYYGNVSNIIIGYYGESKEEPTTLNKVSNVCIEEFLNKMKNEENNSTAKRLLEIIERAKVYVPFILKWVKNKSVKRFSVDTVYLLKFNPNSEKAAFEIRVLKDQTPVKKYFENKQAGYGLVASKAGKISVDRV